ncbi:hypothetical protein NHX12_026955 [Muraenolepis orangiensis]|uniref:Uncharacterized protein n=1 Tax=Muraenolepis orangiensis TaxID=630683 RepID=A0A9Q0EE39_9TELE|nr:hypothetical protein NHX12_026955 [Muraenolepis orangiensis]
MDATAGDKLSAESRLGAWLRNQHVMSVIGCGAAECDGDDGADAPRSVWSEESAAAGASRGALALLQI